MIHIDKTDIIYLAGFVDGEGTLTIAKHRKKAWITLCPLISISNTDKPIVEWLQKELGGYLFVSNRSNSPRYTSNWKLQYRWCRESYEIESLISQLLPYLKIKRRHAEILLQFIKLRHEQGRVKGYSPELWALADELSKLNSKIH